MNIAIYSRKSKFTDTGESIQNQISMCKDYANMHFKDCRFFIYEDEGFSGGNTDRPMFKSLISDIESKQFDVLICYRLDRISRNVADFSETLELLTRNNISFISLKEQFDTSTPMGRAMIYIASVFAQLERDTIAERITDNFTELAKTGRFLLGNPPEGLKLKKITSPDGKVYSVLDIIPDEIDKIKLIYEKYIEYESNTKVQRYCIEHNIRTKKGTVIKSDWVTRILTHPLYAVADRNTYDYFKSMGSQITSPLESFDGSYGITVFRRTKRSGGYHSSLNDPCNWIVGVGSHEGIIPSHRWIKVQNIVSNRSHYGVKMRRTTGNYGLFTGMLRCGKCGDYMRPMSISKSRFYYKCLTKDRSRKSICDIKDVRGDIFDSKIITQVSGMLASNSIVTKRIFSLEDGLNKKLLSNDKRIEQVEKNIVSKQKAIKNLVLKLSETNDKILGLHISVQVNVLDDEIKGLEKELMELNSDNKAIGASLTTTQIIKESIFKITSETFNDISDIAVKRNLLKTIIQSVEWDGANATVNFYNI